MKSVISAVVGTLLSVATPAYAPPPHPCVMAPNPDPMVTLPNSLRSEFACIAYAESRNKLVDTNRRSGAEGMYQILPYLWKYARAHIKGLAFTPNDASLAQQDTVAVWFYQRNNGFAPEWVSDSQCY